MTIKTLRIHLLQEGQGNATRAGRRVVRRQVVELIKILNKAGSFGKTVIKKGFKVKIPVKNEFYDEISIIVMIEPRIPDNKGIRITYGRYVPAENRIFLNGTFEADIKNQFFAQESFGLLNDIIEHELRHWWQIKYAHDPKMDISQNLHAFDKIDQRGGRGESKDSQLARLTSMFLVPMEIDSYLRGTFISMVKKEYEKKKPMNMDLLWTNYLLWIGNTMAGSQNRGRIPDHAILNIICNVYAPKAFEHLKHSFPKIAAQINNQRCVNFIRQKYMTHSMNQKKI